MLSKDLINNFDSNVYSTQDTIDEEDSLFYEEEILKVVDEVLSDTLSTKTSNKDNNKFEFDFNFMNNIWGSNNINQNSDEFNYKFNYLRKSESLNINKSQMKNFSDFQNSTEVNFSNSFEEKRNSIKNLNYVIAKNDKKSFIIKKNNNSNFNRNNRNPMSSIRNIDNSRKNGNSSDDKQNRIILENIFRIKDKRTTLMIRNIPNKYTLKSIIKEINSEFDNKYDLFYLPIDYVNNCNLGFAFINFVDPFHIMLFYERFRGRKWQRFNSEKICELVYAKFQGKRDLISHFEKGSVLNYVSEDKRPLILPTPNSLPQIDIPINFLNAFNFVYPYGTYTYYGGDTFSVKSLYDF